MLSVHPAYWQQGIGAALMDRLLDEAWAREYSHAQLWTQAGNDRAQTFYERRGWARSGREKFDDEGAVVVHYSRAL
jgi:GNAT superfamily N-acetyltransferase